MYNVYNRNPAKSDLNLPLKRGFSLVEVTLAMGIMAFALVTIFGLLPVGLNAFNDTAKASASRRIADRLISEIRASSWDQLKGYAEGTAGKKFETKFNLQGETAHVNDPWVFRCNVDVNSDSDERWRYPVSLPGNSGSENNLRRVKIDVAYWPDHVGGGEYGSDGKWIFSEDSMVNQRGDVRTYYFLVSNTDPQTP